MKKFSLLTVLLPCLIFILPSPTQAQQRHIFALGKNEFLLDGKPLQIISGEMHPARIPQQYWRHRIKMAKAMGCNTIAAYVFWNYHETAPGVFDFKTGNHNIAQFIRICHQEGMWVIVRPGPYVCAEWDWGGLPTYLLKILDIKIRCMDSRYMAAVRRYVSHLSKEIKPLLCTNGGPVILTQIENEYGSYGNDKTYLKALKKMWQQNGIPGPYYTADGPTAFMLDAGTVDGAAIGLDSGTSDKDFEAANKQNPNVPSFSSETYPGWLTHWKEKWQRPDTNSLKKEITYLLKNGKSFNFYVIHGGTNFGFTAGANAFSPTQFQPDITSYDYDAPISEQGNATPKYYMLRNLISRYVKYKIPPVPAAVKTIDIPEIKLAPLTSVWKILPKPIASAQPKPMEDYGQNQGFILYRTQLIGNKTGTLTINEPHDFALIFVDGKLVDTINRNGGHWSIKLPKSESKNPRLDILVEGMGHINFAQYMIDRKGITDRVTLNGMTLMDWQTYLLPMSEKMVSTLKPTYPEGIQDGVFYKGQFTLAETGDTYIDMSKYTRGIVYVNGHNLGRYWNVGPQQRLYCPATWLKKGANDITVFDALQNTAATVKGDKLPE
ncbi:MAG: beta-galactosidase family protein [Bacteroidota bacterium]